MKHRNTVGFRDKRYLAFVSGKPCVVCGVPGQAHHYGGQQEGRGVGHKASDQNLVPLCEWHHRFVEKLGREGFENKYAVKFDAVNEMLHSLYLERHGNGNNGKGS